MDRDRRLRDHLVELLRHGNAHMPFAEAVADFPEAQFNTRPPRVDYSFWHLLEHLRLTQADLLAYLTQADYHAPAWPQDYWPAPDTRATKQEWDESVAAFQHDLEAIIGIVADDGTDLFGTVPSNDEHTVLREVLIVADHNAYHIGELGILRQVTNAWSLRHRVE
jgi:DinB superfamily